MANSLAGEIVGTSGERKKEKEESRQGGNVNDMEGVGHTEWKKGKKAMG